MIDSLDDTVGRIRAKLDELKLSDHTILVFTSDNGGRIPTCSINTVTCGLFERMERMGSAASGADNPAMATW